MPTPTPVTATAAPARRPVRERLLAVAEQLFYQEGVHQVGIERVLAEAGVAKASLYDNFGSKEALVAAYLEARQLVRQQRLDQAMKEAGSPRERLLSVFDVLERNMAEPGYRGCAFARVAMEAPPTGSVRTICEEARNWLYRRLLEQAELAGARAPAMLARQLQIVYDGATVATAVDHASDAGHAAKAVAALLVAQHLD